MPERPKLIRVLGHWMVVPAAFTLGLIVLLVLGQAIYAIDTRGLLPNEGTREFLSVLGPRDLWRLVTHRRDPHKRKEFIYREDIL